uniref:Ubiquitin thioesterase OTU n=1 Tax=Mantoniella antarctica TaxID=81844 RepID=A0A7S0SZV5_9CHLO|mmetsp:Transcript_6063/g.15041  ORF Transcript_6063/g.15041 Transcript_6063/m.15041 type:complete len:245 (+) Transcript_6063:116-850(+)|eukprot:CAMPEP_0181357900 /NCGR_PEP_ID=MMETSP1106-20121128/5214_1 /TAXON_ID=81844 /ORGANISM="Mantoniella antarctica, Strain SL-175" /LENGTH=244 /DNA_ID=CAMNT_0023470807 /DNA_START=38 /DNA_END=772 /DNA_ORIENTATION=+
MAASVGVPGAGGNTWEAHRGQVATRGKGVDEDDREDRREHGQPSLAPSRRHRPVRSRFARISESLVDAPAVLFDLAVSKTQAEFHKVIRIRGDGKCMFRALALGLAHIKKDVMTASMEEHEADQLRLAVAESMCRTPEKRKQFETAVTAISFEMPIGTYCKRILTPTFWGGEPELLVLAQILRRPVMVYIPAHKVKSAGTTSGYVCIQTYGRDFQKGGKEDASGKGRKPVRLLYNGENHYDLLV